MSATPQSSYPPSRQPLRLVATVEKAEANPTRFVRVALLIVALMMIAPLALAFSLKPDPSGMGTHQQIPGLGPCSIQVMFGFPCPACGMTTSWSLFTKGQIFAALMTSASGTILAVVFTISSIWMLVVVVRGKWLLLTPTPMQMGVVALAWLVLVTVEWFVRRCPEIFG